MIKEVAEKFKDEVLKLKEYGFTPEIRGLLLNVRNFIDNVLEEDSKHPLELEVDSMLDRAKQGLPPKIRYISKKDGGRWKNPHEFLEEVYGQYLTHFTPSLVKDYIYLHQLKLIDENFYKRLTTYLHASNLSGIVPSISDYSLAKTKEDIPEYKIKIYNEVNRIYTKSSKNSKKKKKETC